MLVLLLAAGLYFVSEAVYNVFFHPLRKVPGPLLAKVSGIWIWYHHFYFRRAYAAGAAHERYHSRIVRIGPNELSFAHPNATREIYMHNKHIQKSDFYEGRSPTGLQNVFTLRNHRAHSGRRKMQSRVYAQSTMLGFEPHVVQKARLFSDALAKRADEKVDLIAWTHIFTLEVLFQHAFGRDAGSIEAGKPHWVLSAMKESKQASVYTFLFRGLIGTNKKSEYIPGFLGRPFRAMKHWNKYAQEILAEEAEKPEDEKTSLMALLAGAADEFLGRPLKDEEVLEETMGTMRGGTGTTAFALTYIFFELARPEGRAYQQRLRDELREAKASASSWPSYNVASKLPFTQACIKEAMRKWPTIPGMLPRQVVGEAVVIDGLVVPPGTVIGMMNMIHHRNAEVFPDPMNYDPDRWMGSDVSKQNEAFTPFSIGPRGCIGQK